MPTSDFRQGDVVRVPFPYTDRNTRQHRPALVVSNGGIGEGAALLWVVMITSAENRPWTGDVSLGQFYSEAGLPVPSVIRPAKIATIEAAHADKLGRIRPRLMAEVGTHLKKHIGL
ncbi:type II toxin-antitoxin system PemK/MazF family toxin (plasmid) [Bosea sp. F3-2]|uniref:type II toxin-antitoxin system PemK/MazF family toxin n=1 Tax=Bosea sp. F3-2 TaxID=2599640 RepID=UPI0011F096BA|nr:type II toxin-antitoxin system PemK/MazF family toxin [Bosea sp. F3-2]QEL26985.1 type II toxin-antitoxin system PemK/MazF family toxin [Bosea sp. F3-2]